MKILLLNWRSIVSHNAGGAEIHCQEIFSRLAAGGHTVRLVASCKDPTKSKWLILNKMEILHVTRIEPMFPVFSLSCMRELPMRGFDVIVEDISKFPIFWPLLISKILSKPFVIIIHHLHGKTLFQELPLPIAFSAYLVELLGLKLYSLFHPYVVTVSESTKRELVSVGFAEERISMIYNCLNFDVVEEPMPGKKDPFPLIVYVGRVKKYKRLDHLILALKKVSLDVKNVKLIIAGRGDKRVYESLTQLAEKTGLAQKVEMYGKIDDEKKRELLQRAWVYATASMKEGSGLSVIEAEAFGVPVVSYNVPGLRDSVRHLFSGLLVKDGDIGALSDSLILVCTDKELRESLSQGAVESVRKYDWNKSAAQFLALLMKILGSSTPRKNMNKSRSKF